MKNPLTLEECAAITRLAGHDLNSIACDCLNTLLILDMNLSPEIQVKSKSVLEIRLPTSKRAIHALQTIVEISSAINYMGDFDSPITLYEPFISWEKHFSSIQEILGSDKIKFTTNLQVSNFKSCPAVLSTIYYNLAKNSRKYLLKIGGNIGLNMQHFFGKPTNLVFENPAITMNNEFIIFQVTDDGPGFRQERPLADYLNKNVSTRDGGGFGLYFTKLAAKYLGAHVGITSVPGKTAVSLYLPTKNTN